MQEIEQYYSLKKAFRNKARSSFEVDVEAMKEQRKEDYPKKFRLFLNITK